MSEIKEEPKQELPKNPFECEYIISALGSKGLKTAKYSYPTLDLYFEILTQWSDNKFKAGKTILAMCYLSGDTEFMYEPEYIAKAAVIATDMIELDFADLKKN